MGIFPTLPDKAHTLSMQTHMMRMHRKATFLVNPGQTPVSTADLPLYSQQKKAQKLFEDVAEDKHVSVIGMLQAEINGQDTGGQLMDGTGWTNMFYMAGIFPPGVARSLLGGKFIKRTRYAYQLTAAWLYILEERAYKSYLDQSIGPHEPFEIWEKRMIKNCPTFRFWITCRNFIHLELRFVRGQRSGDWKLTIDSLKLKCRWCFAFGKTNYARWLPVFLRDMLLLETQHPLVHKAFNNGLFVVQRSTTKFSLMAMDQNQEHCIKFTKHEGGPKGLYGQTEEQDVIEISRPGILRAIQQFEDQLDGVNQANKSIKAHPESSEAEQKKFINHLSSLLRLVDEEKIINPFCENNNELITLDTGEIMDSEIAACLEAVEELGETMMREYVVSRIEKAEKPVTDTISRPGLYTFAN